MIFQERENDKSAVYTQINHLYILEVFFCAETIKYLTVKATGKAEILPNWASSGSYSSKWSLDTFSGII